MVRSGKGIGWVSVWPKWSNDAAAGVRQYSGIVKRQETGVQSVTRLVGDGTKLSIGCMKQQTIQEASRTEPYCDQQGASRM